MKNILYLSYDGMTDPLGQSQVLPYLLGLSEMGHTISLISFEKPERFKSGEQIIREKVNGKVNWYPIMYTKNPPVVSTLYDIFKMEKTALQLHKAQAFDIVHCRSYISALVGEKLKKKLGIKFIFDMRGFWADERVEGGLWNLDNFLYRKIYTFFKKKEKDYLNNADYVISLTHNAKEQIIQNFGVKPAIKIQVIPCCADLEHFSLDRISESITAKWKEKLSISDSTYILGYLGALGTWYMGSEMLDLFKQLLLLKPDAKFLIITTEEPSFVHKMAKEKNIPIEKLIIRSATRNEVPELISLFDSTVFFIRNTFSKRASSPTKQGEMMALGIPLICNSGIGDTDKIVEESNAGFILNDFTNQSYTEILTKMLSSEFDKQKIIAGAHKHYSLKEGVKLYNNVYEIV